MMAEVKGDVMEIKKMVHRITRVENAKTSKVKLTLPDQSRYEDRWAAKTIIWPPQLEQKNGQVMV